MLNNVNQVSGPSFVWLFSNLGGLSWLYCICWMFVQVHCVPSKAGVLGAALESIKGDTFIYLRDVMLRKKTSLWSFEHLWEVRIPWRGVCCKVRPLDNIDTSSPEWCGEDSHHFSIHYLKSQSNADSSKQTPLWMCRFLLEQCLPPVPLTS